MIELAKSFKSDLEVSKFWSYLGSFYDKIDPTQKQTIENYWKALADAVESMLYNINEAYYAQNLNTTKGYIEDGFKVFKINKEECIKERFEPIVLEITGSEEDTEFFEYFVTGIQSGIQTKVSNSVKTRLVNFTLTWNSLESITEYYVYKKGLNNSITIFLVTGNTISSTELEQLTPLEDLIEPPAVDLTVKGYIYNLGTDYFITIPTLKTFYSNKTLVEGIDYKIKNLNQLYLKNDILNYDEYTAEIAIKIPNILKTTFSGLFKDDINFKKIFINNCYTSYLKIEDQFEIKLNDLGHFSKLLHNITLNLMKGCSLKRLEKVLNLFYNVPFAYESGKVEDILILDDFYEITISEVIYKIPIELSPTVNTGDEINKYDLLCSGITVEDYISNPILLQEETTGEEYYHTVIISIPNAVNNLNYLKSFDMLDYLKEILLQPGLKFRII